MMTVKEISKRSSISVRTLHYYDQIGLLHPTVKSEAGYRLYDDKALERLQQILFFREFEIPLKDICVIMDDPSFDEAAILRMQRRMLAAKQERLARLIASIDDILKGDNRMDFAIFTRSELEELSQTSIDRMPDSLRESIAREFGSVQQWQRHYVERASREDVQKAFAKMVEWHGGKEKALDAMRHPLPREVSKAYGRRILDIEARLWAKREMPVNSFEIRQLAGEYGFVMKQLYQLGRSENALMRSVAASYRDPRARKAADERYGDGAGEFFARAIEAMFSETEATKPEN